MSIISLDTLKTNFSTGKIPSGADYADLVDTLANFLTIPSTDITAVGTKAQITVDENNIGFGALLHIDSDGNVIQADSNGVNIMPCQFMATETGTGSKIVLLSGFAKNNSWNWTPGVPLYVSTTSGVMTQTPPETTDDIIQIVGFAISTTVIFFKPDYTFVTIA